VQNLQEIAVEAVKARYSQSRYYGEFLRELEACGCSPEEIQDMLERARSIVPHPQADRALRVLRRASKSAIRGDTVRAERLRAVACDLVGMNEVAALIEEHRLRFTAAMNYPVVLDRPRIRCGFAA